MSNVAVVGLMHSGKTTVAKAFEAHGYRRIAFADPVKDVAAEMLTTFELEMKRLLTPPNSPVLYQHYDYDMMNQMKGNPPIRKLLQLVGTELGRDWFGPDTVWIDIFENKVKQTNEPIINDDCRFPNEAARLKELGFTILKLERDEEERKESVIASLARGNPDWKRPTLLRKFLEMQEHPSETNVVSIEPDITLQSKSIEQLNTWVDYFVRIDDYAPSHS